jgi:hypothetical protein
MKMERIEDTLSSADKRRELRKTLERDSANINKFSMNDLMLAGLVVIAMALSLTDFTLSLGNFKNFTALTLFLYVISTIIYRNRYNRGKFRGRNDPDYIEALEDYRKAKQKIIDGGMASEVSNFCQDYKTKELKEYRKGILADVDLDYDEYLEKYRLLRNRDVMKLSLPLSMRKAIIKCNKATPIKLTPGLIMNESGEADRKKLIAQSGRERELKDKREQIISRGLIVILGGAIAIDVIFNFSFITIVMWFVRMLPIIGAIIMGDDGGFCNIAVTETNFKKGQTAIINLFLEQHKAKEVTISEESPSLNTND